MPIYEYTCKSCDEKFDHLARAMSSRDQAEKVKCPQCGSMKTSRALSVVAAPSGKEPEGYMPNRNDSHSCGHCGGPPGSCKM